MRILMTRENKLALIIGFGLVLVVGILVSDHLSAASRQESADLSPESTAASSDRLRDTALLTPMFPEPAASRRAPSGRSGAPVATNGTNAGSNPRQRDAVPVPEDGAEVASGPQSPPELDPMGVRIDDIVHADVEIPNEIVNPRQDALIRGDVEEVQQRLREAAERQIAFSWYTIKPGETLAKIAREKLGDEKLWRQLHEINRDRIPNPNVVPSGVTIRLPKKEDLIVAAGAPAASPPGGAAGTAGAGGASAVRYTTYTVLPGESLSKVASKVLGTGNRWRELYELNKDVIRNPDIVTAGTVLKVPAR
jgi:nucleoid-associated protein YgaU